MAYRENIKHPNFIIGAVSFIILLTGVVVKGNKYRIGDYLIMLSVALGGFKPAVLDNSSADYSTRWSYDYYMMKEKNGSL